MQLDLAGISVLLYDYSIFANKDQRTSRTSKNAVYVSGYLEIISNVSINLLSDTDIFTVSNSRIGPNDVTGNLLSAPERIKDAMDVFI